MIQQFHFWVCIWRKWKHLKRYASPCYIDALFTTAKVSKQPKCPLIDKWKKNTWYVCIYNEILFSHKKEWNLAICDNTDRPQEHYAKENTSDRERQILYDLTYMWNLKKQKQ